MKRKKFLFLLMGVLMLVRMAMPAFAVELTGEDTDMEGNKKVQIKATCALPEISVTVPALTDTYLNPYKLSVGLDPDGEGPQIISQPVAIQNESPVPLSVTAAVTGKIGSSSSDMKLSTTSVVDSGVTTKRVFIYFEIQASNNPESYNWASEYDAAEHLLVGTTQRTKKNIVILDAAQDDTHKNRECYGVYHLAGDCVVSPKTKWSSKDSLSVSVVFTFDALPNED